MLVNVRIYRVCDHTAGLRYVTIEDHTLPSGSWLQPECGCGMISVVAVHQPELQDMGRGYVIGLWPRDPVGIPAKLLKLVAGNDHAWGRNGIEWMGCERESQGGTPVDRVRHYAANYRQGMYGGNGRRAWGAYATKTDCPPIELTDEEVAVTLGEQPPCAQESLDLFADETPQGVPDRIREWEAAHLQ